MQHSFEQSDQIVQTDGSPSTHLDLSGAQWIWYPSERTLANTVILFRRQIICESPIRQARGWILADSRYRLSINGQRMQWGPAPADPRWPEADPLDLTESLQVGQNVVGIAVLFFGSGDGTWPTGKPGLIFRLNIEYVNGARDVVVSDDTWGTRVDRSHPPGQYRRWYLRALQEIVDLRVEPQGWDLPDDIGVQNGWISAMLLGGSAQNPAICTNYTDYSWEVSPAQGIGTGIVPRSIPLLRETLIPLNYVECRRVEWSRSPDDWFEFRTPNSYRIGDPLLELGSRPWRVPVPTSASESFVLTFCLEQGMVGWPQLTVDAPSGTIIEVIVAEAHDVDQCGWLDHGFFSWSRFICREGVNALEPFDYEGFRWLQIHIRGHQREVTVSTVAIRQREYPWPQRLDVQCHDVDLQRLWQANWNTLRNSAQETVVDGMARERQQYSGDSGHQLRVLRLGTGDLQLSARFLKTYSQGITPEGYFLDAWPAFDRLNRIALKQIGLATWGPILDHGLGFAFDTWQYYWDTGDLTAVRPAYASLRQFARYLEEKQKAQADGLLPVEGLGLPVVWLDHEAYRSQPDKACTFNLYVVAALREALAPLARALGEDDQARAWDQLASTIETSVVRWFWSSDYQAFVDNLPRLKNGESPRYSDFSLALALTYGLGPRQNEQGLLDQLESMPDDVGRSYPANSWWRYRALAQGRRMGVVLQDFRQTWANMPSVVLNHTLQENWKAKADSRDEWSHAAMAPLLVLFTEMVGLRALAPGFSTFALRPQLADIEEIVVTLYTPQGPCCFEGRLDGTGYHVQVVPPMGGIGYLEVCSGQLVQGTLREAPSALEGWQRFHLEPDKENEFWMRSSNHGTTAPIIRDLASAWRKR